MNEFYLPKDFNKSPKYDAHIHYSTFDDLFVRKAAKANIRLISINTNFNFSIDRQFEICQFIHQRHPQTFNFLCTFDATTFTSKTFAEDSVGQIKKCMAAGARGVKIWKNIGMILKNKEGQYIMADDHVFDPIFAFLEKEKIPLLAHLGEPRNCWLPLECMTINTDRQYFSKNPNFHMCLHPEVPSYEQQIMARDRILERYPGLIFIGAHLGSMEWNLEEVAKRFDRFPNFYVDIAGRFAHIFEQTLRNRSYVIDFFQTYQKRIVYGGLDINLSPNSRWINFCCKYFPHVFMNLLFRYSYRAIKKHWLFFATDKVFNTKKMNDKDESIQQIEGLKLSKNIVGRIFYENAHHVYFNPIIRQ